MTAELLKLLQAGYVITESSAIEGRMFIYRVTIYRQGNPQAGMLSTQWTDTTDSILAANVDVLTLAKQQAYERLLKKAEQAAQ